MVQVQFLAQELPHVEGMAEKKIHDFFFFFLRVTSAAYGGSQARGRIEAVASGLHCSNSRSEPRLQPTPQLTTVPDP